ncbi:MAG: family 14 glycosylhydrolase [Candidatus Melainabacteria bacterium]|nr:family 14 glycosylhydrolase [Candidatus Melainabacteria bacterium]
MKSKNITINVMAPLLVGTPTDMGGASSRQEVEQFKTLLRDAKARGVKGVSIDVWWGLVELTEGNYTWGYYRQLFQLIIDAGLKVVPIISTHQCGGNVGDGKIFVPIPEWVWPKLAKMVPSGKVEAVQYVSERGNACAEVVSAFATHLILDSYRKLFSAFRDEFADIAKHIAEINISLGPAGELRYASYKDDDNSNWPNRGALQCYSQLAIASLRAWVLEKYGVESEVAKAWGFAEMEPEDVAPPTDAGDFFKRKQHVKTVYGRDLLQWYHETLLKHGRMVMSAALEIFDADGSPFKGIDLGAKIPGVHWRMGEWVDGKVVLSDRLAEIPTGLIRVNAKEWSSDELGRGYKSVVSFFKELNDLAKHTRVVLHFTCLEMPDGADGKKALSLANSLVRWVGAEAKRQGVPIKGENALNFTLPVPQSWDLMRSALALPGQDGVYEGLTLLRIGDVLQSDVCKAELEKIVKLFDPDEVESPNSQGPPEATKVA